MLSKNNSQSNPLLLYDSKPDSRQHLQELLSLSGYTVLAVRSLPVASSLLHEHAPEAFILCTTELTVNEITALVDARHSYPNMPVLLVFHELRTTSIPEGLVDATLVSSDGSVLVSLLQELSKKQPSNL